MLTALAHTVAVLLIFLGTCLALFSILGVWACAVGQKNGKPASTVERIVGAVVFATSAATGVLVVAVMVVTW